MASSTNAHPIPIDEYWKNAYHALDPTLQANIGGARTGKRDITAAVLQTAEQKREISIHKRWKFKLSNGEVIIIRDVVEKITKWVKMFVAVGDVATSYHPETAALPWAAVRFILQAAINETEVHGSMVADLETISRLVSRYKEFERVHLGTATPVQEQLKDGLTLLYADVLKYLATAVKFFDTRSFSKFANCLEYAWKRHLTLQNGDSRVFSVLPMPA